MSRRVVLVGKVGPDVLDDIFGFPVIELRTTDSNGVKYTNRMAVRWPQEREASIMALHDCFRALDTVRGDTF